MNNLENKKRDHFPYWCMIMFTIIYIIFPPIYYQFKKFMRIKSPLQLKDYYIMILVLIFVITGGYQLYFWCQDAYIGEVHTIQESAIDKYIPKIDLAIYIYSFIYYLGIGLVIITIKSYEQFTNILFIGLLLLILHAIFFILLPTKLPESSRNDDNKPPMMELSQRYDKIGNAYPSMHVSIAILVFFLIKPVFGNIALLFPIFIIVSCLMTKQHFFADCMGGAIYGVIFVYLINRFYPYKVF